MYIMNSNNTHFLVGDGVKIHFLKDMWWGDQTLCSHFPNLFKVLTIRNFSISSFLIFPPFYLGTLTFIIPSLTWRFEDLGKTHVCSH